MEKIEVIVSLAGTAMGLLITAITFIVKFLRSARARRLWEQLTEIGEAVIPYIEQAETFPHYSGAEKKEFVITKANQFAIEKGYAFSAKLVGEKIEELVKLTKKVNAREKDKIAKLQPYSVPTFNPQPVSVPVTPNQQ